MVCKKCGTESLVEGAVYCANCGERLDGKIQCGNCKQFNDGANAFCIFCGTRIDGKTVCKNCGQLIEGAFCAHCGTAVVPEKKTAKGERTAKPKLWDKIFGLTSGGIALLGALLALIFVFLIGFAMKITGEAEEIQGVIGSTWTINIYHFFGDAYKEIADMEAALDKMLCGSMLKGDMYVYTIVCTVLAVATIGCTVGFAVPAIITYVQYATGKKEKMNSKWALLTIFSFLGGLAMLFAHNYMKLNLVYGEVFAKAVVKPNGATMAGIILCFIFAILWLAAKLISYGKEWKNKAFIKKAVCVSLSIALVSALLIVWSQLAQGVKIVQEKGENVIATYFAPWYNNVYFVSMAESMLSEAQLLANESKLMAFYVCNILMVFVSIGGVVCIIGCLKARASAADGKNYTGLVFSILLFALTILPLVFFIVMQVNMQAIFEVANGEAITSGSLKINYKYGTCIAVMVLAALNLAVSITQTVFKKQKAE